MREVLVMKPFLYSADGVTEHRAEMGDTPKNIPLHLQPGLAEEGFIEIEDNGVKINPNRPDNKMAPTPAGKK